MKINSNYSNLMNLFHKQTCKSDNHTNRTTVLKTIEKWLVSFFQSCYSVKTFTPSETINIVVFKRD